MNWNFRWLFLCLLNEKTVNILKEYLFNVTIVKSNDKGILYAGRTGSVLV